MFEIMSFVRHDLMVEQMLAAQKQLAAAPSDKDRNFYTDRCDGDDCQIDALAYDLYALTPDEIKIVESKNEIPLGQPLSDRHAKVN
jgi:hypothetical protein